MDNIDNNTETVNRPYQSKGPFIGIILFLVGLLLLVITLVSNDLQIINKCSSSFRSTKTDSIICFVT